MLVFWSACLSCVPVCQSNFIGWFRPQGKYRATLEFKSSGCAISNSFIYDSSLSLSVSQLHSVKYLKLVSAIFYQICIFSSNDSLLKTIKNVFYFISKALFALEIFKFLWFFTFLSTRSRFKRTNGSGISYDVMNWLA